MKKCLLKLRPVLKDFNTAEVESAAKTYQSRGMGLREASVKAIEDHLRSLSQEQKRIESDVLKAWEKRDPEGYAAAQPKEPVASKNLPATTYQSERVDWEDLGERFDSKSEAEAFAEAEVGVRHRVVRTRDGDWAIETSASLENDSPLFGQMIDAEFINLDRTKKLPDLTKKNGEEEPSASRATEPAQTKHEGMAKRGEEIVSKWKGAVPVVFHENADDITDERLRGWVSRNGDGEIEGFYDPVTKTIHIITGNISSMERMEFVLASHEAFHAGLRKLLPKEIIDPVLGEIYDTNANIRTEADKKIAAGMARETAVEEVMADMPEAELTDLKGWDKLVRIIQEFFYKIGLKHKWTDADVANLVAASRAAVRDGLESPVSTKTKAAEVFADPAASVDVRSKNFRKWFGDSKVVDEDGKPLVVYHHGSFTEDGNFTPNGPMHFGTKYAAEERAYGKRKDTEAMAVQAYQSDDGMWHWELRDGTTSDDLAIPGFSSEDSAILYGRSQALRFVDEDPDLAPEDIGVITSAYLSLKNPKRVPDLGGANGEWAAAIKKAKEEGYDGLVYRNKVEDKGSDSYVAFRPEQIKSAIGNNGDFDPDNPDITASKPADKWYSELARVVAAAKQQTAPAAQWAAWLKNQQGVKKEELEWSGVLDWLATQGKVTKQQILDFLNANGVKVEEKMLDGAASRYYIEDGGGELVEPGRYSYATLAEANADLDRVREETGLENLWPVEDAELSAAPKFEQYALPGGTNYRELLLTLPERLESPSVEKLRAKAADTSISQAARKAAQDELDRVLKLRSAAMSFRSTHFDQPNILAHVRFDERTDADGKRILFIEEIQSDWGQEGKRVGFAKEATEKYTGEVVPEGPAEGYSARQNVYGDKKWYVVRGGEWGVTPYDTKELAENEIPTGWRVNWSDGSFSGGYGTRSAAEDRLARGKGNGREGVPPAPFVTKTESWTALAVKRLIRYAVDNGFDGLAFTNGEQQADRYNLAKQVDEVRITKAGDGKFDIEVTKDRGRGAADILLSESDIGLARIEELVGKDLAKKASEQTKKVASYTGLDLKVGGEGMRGFYDKIVPVVANDVLKKLGGGRVGVVPFETNNGKIRKLDDGRYEVEDSYGTVIAITGTRAEAQSKLGDLDGSQPGFYLNDAIREKAAGGMPLFSKQEKGSEKQEEKIDEPLASKVPKWVSSGSPDLQSAASKIDTYAPEQTIQQKAQELKKVWKDRLVQKVFDAYAPLKKLGRKEYILARMAKASGGAFEGMLLYGKPKIDQDGAIYGDIDKKGFLGAMADLQGEHDRFLMWVAGNRSDRLMKEGKENLFTKQEIDAMKALDQGKMPDGSSRKQAYAKAQSTLNEYNKAVLDVTEKTGLIDGESRKFWEHDFYVPFFRVDEDMSLKAPSSMVKGLVRQEAFKRLKGGKESLGDLLDNTLRNWSHLLAASMANQGALASLTKAVSLGVAVEGTEKTMKDMADSVGFSRGATYAMDGGVQRWFFVEDPMMLEAISAMESASFKGLPMEVMSKFKHYLTLGVTVSPTFRVRNLMRDSISAIGQNDVSYNILKNMQDGYKGLNRKTDDYAQKLFSGGLIRFGNLTDGKHAEHAKRLIQMGVKDQTILDTRTKVKDALTKIWDEWQEFGDLMENINRSAIYDQKLKETGSRLEAAYAARDAMDFSLQGSSIAVRFLTQLVPFMNARLQGMYKLGRAGYSNPARLGMVVGATALASIALLLAYHDDDEWKKREDWDRDNFWAFRIGDTMYRIPKPFEIGAMGTIAERSVEMLISDEMNGKRMRERLMSMLGDTFALNPIPQAFKPAIDIYSNKDSFTGRQIETRGMENLSKPERMNSYTSMAARILGKAGDTTGLSPVQIDHLLRAYFGWLGSHAAMAVDVMAEPFMDVKKPARKVGDLFVVGDFVKDLPSSRSRYLEDFYKDAKRVSETMGDIRKAREAGQLERAREILQDRKQDVMLNALYSGAERRMSDISRRIRIIESGKMEPEMKRQRIDELKEQRNKLAKFVSDRARKVREPAQ